MSYRNPIRDPVAHIVHRDQFAWAIAHLKRSIPMKYEANGKEILRNGQHFGDATTPEDADLIVKALTMMEATPDPLRQCKICGGIYGAHFSPCNDPMN